MNRDHEKCTGEVKTDSSNLEMEGALIGICISARRLMLISSVSDECSKNYSWTFPYQSEDSSVQVL